MAASNRSTPKNVPSEMLLQRKLPPKIPGLIKLKHKIVSCAYIDTWVQDESLHFLMKTQVSKWHLLTVVRDSQLLHLLLMPLLDHFHPKLPARISHCSAPPHSLGQDFVYQKAKTQ